MILYTITLLLSQFLNLNSQISNLFTPLELATKNPILGNTSDFLLIFSILRNITKPESKIK